MTSRTERIQLALKELDPRSEASPEAVELVAKLVQSFVEEVLKRGEIQAEARSKAEKKAKAPDQVIRLGDIRPFVQDSLRLDVPGFAVDDLVDEAEIGSRFVIAAVKRLESSTKHLKRVEEERRRVGDPRLAAEADAKIRADAMQIVDSSSGKSAKNKDELKKKKRRISKDESK